MTYAELQVLDNTSSDNILFDCYMGCHYYYYYYYIVITITMSQCKIVPLKHACATPGWGDRQALPRQPTGAGGEDVKRLKKKKKNHGLKSLD